MDPIIFPQAGHVMGPPTNMTEEECQPLPVHLGYDEAKLPVVVSCWQPSDEELAEIAKTGKVWLIVYGHTMPPVAVTGKSLFP